MYLAIVYYESGTGLNFEDIVVNKNLCQWERQTVNKLESKQSNSRFDFKFCEGNKSEG